MTTGKTIGLTRWNFVDKVMSLLFNTLSRFVITFFPRNKCLFISWLQSPSPVILEPRKTKSVTVSTVSSSICHEVMEIQPVHSKGDQPWVFFRRTDAKAETPILWPPDANNWLVGKDWCWEGLGAGEEGDNRGWDGWMASPTRWTWVWINSGSWWWTGRPGVLRFMGSQRRTRLSDWTETHF